MNSTTKTITVGVAIAVLSGLILAGFRACGWMRDTIIRLEERAKR